MFPSFTFQNFSWIATTARSCSGSTAFDLTIITVANSEFRSPTSLRVYSRDLPSRVFTRAKLSRATRVPEAKKIVMTTVKLLRLMSFFKELCQSVLRRLYLESIQQVYTHRSAAYRRLVERRTNRRGINENIQALSVPMQADRIQHKSDDRACKRDRSRQAILFEPLPASLDSRQFEGQENEERN